MAKEDQPLTLAGDPDKFDTQAAVGAHLAKQQKAADDEGEDKDAPEVKKKGNPVSRFVLKFCKLAFC